MRDLLDGTTGEPMTRADYLVDFWDRFWTAGGAGVWKLERGQHFREPGYDVWEAFDRGDWAGSLRLLEVDRAQIAAEHRRMRQRGVALSWVRVVERPISAYVRWNLHVLRVRQQCGTDARVVGAGTLAAREAAGPLPELVTVGTSVAYELRYDGDGTLDGAYRHTDPDLVRRCRRAIADLHAAGEPLRGYFLREVAAAPGGS
ncbi:DUF6879 family protein [Micromonospora sp. NPDC049799]|uniref:DUF6879 family protein n=1 Tax=Micromonospora sp. NPDC049799 TaxID=3154741 RepID=UPI0033E683FD